MILALLEAKAVRGIQVLQAHKVIKEILVQPVIPVQLDRKATKGIQG